MSSVAAGVPVPAPHPPSAPRELTLGHADARQPRLEFFGGFLKIAVDF